MGFRIRQISGMCGGREERMKSVQDAKVNVVSYPAAVGGVGGRANECELGGVGCQ